jgi:hypothetical protein
LRCCGVLERTVAKFGSAVTDDPDTIKIKRCLIPVILVFHVVSIEDIDTFWPYTGRFPLFICIVQGVAVRVVSIAVLCPHDTIAVRHIAIVDTFSDEALIGAAPYDSTGIIIKIRGDISCIVAVLCDGVVLIAVIGPLEIPQDTTYV